ncbi:hypothetical protein CUMW_268700 [Citrus unshiu]|uniref:Uncharacterized protein n=1 Tax=Citrus unshiu TaxID=55188 RepID=A0A2H5QWR4_CITUN|nr:hypothetical protein CUMW_268700 [Citrus unshiu]
MKMLFESRCAAGRYPSLWGIAPPLAYQNIHRYSGFSSCKSSFLHNIGPVKFSLKLLGVSMPILMAFLSHRLAYMTHSSIRGLDVDFLLTPSQILSRPGYKFSLKVFTIRRISIVRTLLFGLPSQKLLPGGWSALEEATGEFDLRARGRATRRNFATLWTIATVEEEVEILVAAIFSAVNDSNLQTAVRPTAPRPCSFESGSVLHLFLGMLDDNPLAVTIAASGSPDISSSSGGKEFLTGSRTAKFSYGYSL